MDGNNEPILSALDKAMAGDRPPIQHNEPVNTGTTETTGSYDSVGSSQNPLDLNQYEESMSRPMDEVIRNAEEGVDTPTVVVAKAKDETDTTVVRDLYKETRDRNIEANRGFVGSVPSDSHAAGLRKMEEDAKKAMEEETPEVDVRRENEELRKTLEETNRRLAELEETVKKLKELTQEYDDPEKLQKALDPDRERKPNPLEDVKNLLRKQESERQKKFVDAVHAENLAHNPLYGYDDPEKLQKALDPDKEREPNPLEDVKNLLRKQEAERQKKFADAVEAERLAHDPLYKKDNEKEQEELAREKQELDDATRKRERRLKVLGLIGGAGGFAATVIGGSAVIAPLTIGSALVAVASLGTVEHIAPKRINRITEKLKNATTDEEKAKLEKELKIWNKVREVAVHTFSFSTGAAIGSTLGGIVSGAIFGGRSIFEVINSSKQAAATEGASMAVRGTTQATAPQAPTATPPVEPIPTPAAETFTGLGDYFDTGLTPQQYSSLGWRGSRIILNPAEAAMGEPQSEFFNTMARIVGDTEKIRGYEAARIYNPFFQNMYRGTMTPVQAATQAANAILGN